MCEVCQGHWHTHTQGSSHGPSGGPRRLEREEDQLYWTGRSLYWTGCHTMRDRRQSSNRHSKRLAPRVERAPTDGMKGAHGEGAPPRACVHHSKFVVLAQRKDGRFPAHAQSAFAAPAAGKSPTFHCGAQTDATNHSPHYHTNQLSLSHDRPSIALGQAQPRIHRPVLAFGSILLAKAPARFCIPHFVRQTPQLTHLY